MQPIVNSTNGQFGGSLLNFDYNLWQTAAADFTDLEFAIVGCTGKFFLQSLLGTLSCPGANIMSVELLIIENHLSPNPSPQG